MRGPFLPPWLLQVFGLTLILAFSVYWAVTGQQSALLVGAGVSLCTLGAVQGVRIRVERQAEGEEEEGGS